MWAQSLEFLQMRSEIHLLVQSTDDFDPATGDLAIKNKMRPAAIFALSRAYYTGLNAILRDKTKRQNA